MTDQLDLRLPSRVRVARGPRAVEALLLRELERLVPGGCDPALLAVPVRVVVPSRSLADHVSTAVARRAGRAVLGVSIRSLDALAQEVAVRGGCPLAGGEALFHSLVRERARLEPSLRGGLDALDDGYAAVEANVRDLLDAGFEPAHRDPLADAIADAAAGELAARAQAVLDVTTGLARILEEGRVGHRSLLLRRAADLLRDAPELLPARAVLLLGFADATGVQLDFLEQLLRLPGASLFLDRPADPADPGREDSGAVFTRRVVERLAPGALPPAEGGSAAAELEVLHAPGPESEVRAVADRVAELLQGGLTPESVGVVARDLAAYRLPIRRHFRRLGIPFSGREPTGPPRQAGRRLSGLLALLREGSRFAAERWLDLVRLDEVSSFRRRADVSLALHALGAPRLEDLARAELQRELAGDGGFRLPVRTGLETGEGGRGPWAPHREVPLAALRAAAGSAASLCQRLEGWPNRARLDDHLAELRAVVTGELGWGGRAPGLEEVANLWHCVDALGGVELERGDFLLLLERELGGAGCDELGGAGAGVRVLSVMEARQATFEALFVLGMNRDLFPRTITEDPLLPDFLRLRLRAVLPELPVKREGVDEERYLFAQLLGASPRVTLACCVTDDDGKRRQPSPLVERLRLAGPLGAPLPLPSLHGRRRLEEGRAHTAHEHALLAGLHGTRERFAALLPAALDEAWRDDRQALAEPRLAVLREIDAVARQPRDLGPYFGFVGPRLEAGDLRDAPLYVTTAERLAGCPWQAFLARLLRLELLPDALAQLPRAVEGRLVGSLVHDVLERIVSAGEEEHPTLEGVARRQPREVPWPEQAQLEGWLEEAARSTVRDEGIGLPGYHRVLAAAARPSLERARAVAWAGGAPQVLGAEVTGEVRVRERGAGQRTLHFRADRVDRLSEGLRLLDYKTGTAQATARSPKSRRDKLRALVSSGVLLQAAAYAVGAQQATGAAARGEYLFLKPGTEEHAARLAVEAEDEELVACFEDAVAAALEVWGHGSFFPRLADPDGDEPRPCSWCDVREACWRGDSGARARLVEWVDGHAGLPEDRLTSAERALLGLWRRG